MATGRTSAAVHPVLRLVRAGNTVVSFAGTVVGGLVARGAGITWDAGFFTVLLLAAFSTSFVTAGGNVLNDVLDRDSDRINHPGRPLVTGEISVASARALATGLFVAGIVVVGPVLLYRPWMAVILAAAVGSLLAYELRLKARGLSGNVLVAFLTAAVFLYGGAAAGPLLLVVPFSAMAFGATFSREVIKDMEDMGGDVERRTLPRTHGLPLAGSVARIGVAAAIVLSPIPLVSFLPARSIAGIIYLGLVLAADALFVVSVAWLPERLHREQTMSKGAMTIALLAFLAATFR